MAKLRVYITVTAIVLYTGLFNLFIYELISPFMSLLACKLFYNYITMGFLFFFLVDWKSGYVNYMHGRLNLGCVWILIFQYALVICNYYGVKDPVLLFASFNIAIFVSGIILAVNYFKTTWKR